MNKFQPQGKFRNAKTSIVTPENSGLRLVINPIDTKASFNSPVNVKLASKWKKIRDEGRSWCANKLGFAAGELQSVAVQSDIWILNVVLSDDEKSLEKCFKKIAALAKYEKASVHMSEDMLLLNNFETLATQCMLNEGVSIYLYKS